MGAQMVKEVASKTSDNAGDGTTTILTGGTVISEEVGLSLEKATIKDLGRARNRGPPETGNRGQTQGSRKRSQSALSESS